MSTVQALAQEWGDTENAIVEAGEEGKGEAAWTPIPLCCWCHTHLVQALIYNSKAWVCPTPACMERQLKWAFVSNKKGEGPRLLYLPLPRQTQAIEAVDSGKYRRILYGGAAGGGKSRFLRWLAYYLCSKYENFNVLLLRRTWPELEETHIREAVREDKLIGAKCTPSNRVVDFPLTKSVLKFGHCQDAKDMTDYLSREYDLILFDELVTFTEEMYLLISSRARSGTEREGWDPMVVAGTNPGGPGAAWVSELFIDKNRDKKKYPAYKPQSHHFIRALLDDNPYVSPGYVEFLMDLPPEMREAYRWGRWDIFPGQYFKEFRKHRHVARLIVPPSLPRVGGMDWGYLRPGIFLWAVPLDDGRLYIEREWVFQETSPLEVGQMITLMTKIWGWTLQESYGDPAMAIRNHESGKDIFETLENGGLYVRPGKHERVNGWMQVRQWLRPLPNGQPALVISPDCEYLVRTLPQLMQDSTKLEDVDTKGEDHAADALRYLLMSRSHPLLFGGQKVYSPGTVGEMFQQARAGTKPQFLGSDNVYR